MILLVREDREYLREPGAVLETDLGVLEVPAEPMPGEELETHLGTVFTVREPRGPDFARHFERTGAPMLPRDIGLVVGHTGVGAGDRALDVGTGTGVLAAYLGRLDANVVTYERNPEAAAVAHENMALAGVSDTVDVREGEALDDIEALSAGTDEADTDRADTDGSDPDRTDFDERSEAFDLVTLDTADAPAMVERTPELLVSGGFCAVYSPFVESAREVVETAREVGLTVDTYETIQRELDVDERGTRPTTGGVGHTGFLSICRRE